MEGHNGWDRYDCIWKVLWIGQNYRSNRYLVPVLPAEGEQMHALGWDGGCVKGGHWLHTAQWVENNQC